MVAVDPLVDAFFHAMTWEIIRWLLFGLVIGLIIGGIPGVGPVLGMAVFLPLTIGFSGLEASVMILTMYAGGVYGASITAILVNIPGTASSAATTFDGYSMTVQGKGKEALAISATSSTIGGTITILAVMLFLPYVTPVVRAFKQHHIFLIALLGILMIPIISQRSGLLKGTVAGAFGVLIMTIGIAPTSPDRRYTFEQLWLWDGLDFIAIIIALFAVSEMIRLANKEGGIVDEATEVTGSTLAGVKTALRYPLTMVKSSMIGLIVGAIPGAGASASNFIAYTAALRSSDNPESFGQGNPEGVVAAEASNNGTIAGSILPVLAFGIPGSASTAVLLAAWFIHGVSPGAQLFAENIQFTYTMIFALIIANAFILLLGLTIIAEIGERLVKVDKFTMIPVIMSLSVYGTYAMRRSYLDIATIFVLGIIAYYMIAHHYSVIAAVLGAVLAGVMERTWYQSMQINGTYWVFVGDALAIGIISVIIYIVFYDAIKRIALDVFRRLRGLVTG